MLRQPHCLLAGALLTLIASLALAADTTTGVTGATTGATSGAIPDTTAGATATTPAAATAAPPAQEEVLSEVIVEAPEPRYVAPTRRDRIGRIWAPVLIDGKGPYRLVLDTGANRSAITTRTAELLGTPPTADGATRVTGFTGTAVVPTVHAGRLEVGELLMGPTNLPVLSDVFGGAQGVLGLEGTNNLRIYADFRHDQLEISRSHGERARKDFTVVPLTLIRGGLLVADMYVGRVRTKAIIDTGAQSTVGNLALRDALMRHAPRDATHEEIIGVTLDVQSGDSIPAPDIDLGHLTVHGVRVTFGDMYLFQHWKMTDQPALTLGMDLLGSFDVLIIDYARRELQIRLREAPHVF